MRISFLLCVVLILTSCAIPITEQYKTLESKTPCCNNLSDIKFTLFDLEKEQKVVLNEKSPVIMLGDEKSYFKAFQLPNTLGKYFYIESYFSGLYVHQYLDPVFVELDKNKKILSSFSLRMEFVEKRTIFAETISMISAFIPNPKTKYLLILTIDQGLNDSVVKTSPRMSTYMVGNTPNIMFVQGESLHLKKTPTGRLSIQLRKFKDKK